MNEGSGPTLYNNSPNTTNWSMTIQGYTNSLWGYQQPGAYTFANGGYFETAETSSPGWTSGDNLTLTASFNVCGNVHNPGNIYGGGAIFGAGYFVPGGNGQGYNFGAFYAMVNTANPAAPDIEFDVSNLGSWSASLPTSVCDSTVNGGWNTVAWAITNNKQSNSMTLQFVLNGTNVGAPINIAGGYLKDFTSYANYEGTTMEIGTAASGGYRSFAGAISNVSLVTVSAPFFTTTPANQTVLPGANVTFTAVAAGTAPLSYQWYFNGTNVLSDATSASLTLADVATNQSGAYTLVVSNSLGTASATADLAIYVRALLAVQRYNGLMIQGSVGFHYLIQYTNVGTASWETLTNLALPSSPYYWFDVQAPASVLARTYRVVAAP
jgi:hypothetical protein